MTTTLDRLLGDVGTDPLVVTLGRDWPAPVSSVIPCDRVGPVTIRHGRSDFTDQPDPAVCTLSITHTDGDDPPVIGDTLDVALGPAMIAYLTAAGAVFDAAAIGPRFTGKITDPKATLTPDGYVYAVTAVSRRAILNQTPIGDVPWPAESAIGRADRILALVNAAEPITWTYDPVAPNPIVLGRDVDRQPAGGLLDELAEDTRATLVERRNGSFEWRDAGGWGAFVPVVTLAASDVLRPVTWAQSPAGVVTDVTVEYGLADPRDVEAVTVAGPAYPVTSAVRIASQLADQPDALALATDLIDHRSRPWWRLEALTVDMLRHDPAGPVGVDPQTAADLLALQPADLLAVDGLPTSGPFAARRLWAEGWTETITARGWRMALDVTDYRAKATAPAWTDAPTGLSWADVPAGMTWADAREPWLDL